MQLLPKIPGNVATPNKIVTGQTQDINKKKFSTFLPKELKWLGYRDIIYISVHVGTMNKHEKMHVVYRWSFVSKGSKARYFFIGLCLFEIGRLCEQANSI